MPPPYHACRRAVNHGGAGKPTAKVIEEAVDRFAFLIKELGMEQGAAQALK